MRDDVGPNTPQQSIGRKETLYTLGHSTRSLDDLLQLLRAHDVDVLADVRRFPRSPRNPQFNDEHLARSLPEAGVGYVWLAPLGGRRRSRTESLANAGWRNPGFRAYADHMLTDEFERGLAELLGLARCARVAIMCSEAVLWRCHRSLIADVLTTRGSAVCHIMGRQRAEFHRLTSFARVDGHLVTYPPPD